MDIEKEIAALLAKVRSYNPAANLKIIEKAVVFSRKVHEGQNRFSGDPAFTHNLSIAHILADLKLDSHTIAAGLLHDVLKSGVDAKTFQKEFDAETLSLVEAISKLKHVKNSISLEEYQEVRAENLRKVLLATSKDIRVILIKIADRLDNMRTLDAVSQDRRKIIAQETLDIYAPIAAKLGMYGIRSELEDLAFRELNPAMYEDIRSKIVSKKEQREYEIRRIVDFVRSELEKNKIHSQVYGRAKNLYSIYKKIIKHSKNFDEIFDLMAIRIITNTVDDCYKALGIIHKLWTPMPGRFKDYIALAKPNGYQSLHTNVIIGEGTTQGKILEVQIRDKDMHAIAEEGIAGHWLYKDTERDKKFDRQIGWLKQILEWKRTSDAQDFIESLKIDLFQKQMFVFTPKGDLISVPQDATPVDFAYAVHTGIGDYCKGAKVNGQLVPLDHTLQPGDIVEIQTVKEKVATRAWLSFVRSPHARIKIKHTLGMKIEKSHKGKDSMKESLKNAPVKFPSSMLHERKRYDIKIPRCCSPQMNDQIRAFKTKDGKIVIHKSSCKNILSNDMTKEITLALENKQKETLSLRVDVKDRVGVLADILSMIAQDHVHIIAVNTRFGRDGRIIISLDILDEGKDYSPLATRLKNIESVINAFVSKD